MGLVWGFRIVSRLQCYVRYLKGQGLSKSVISRVIIRVTPFRALITLLITYYLLSPCPFK